MQISDKIVTRIVSGIYEIFNETAFRSTANK